MKRLTFKEAYLVKGWGTEVIKGFGSKTQKDGFFSGDQRDTIIFSTDMKTFSFEDESSRFKNDGVYFDYGKAHEAIQKEKQKYIEFCEKEVKEYSDKLATLNTP